MRRPTSNKIGLQRISLRNFAQPATYLGVMMLITVGIATVFSIHKERQDAYEAAVRNGDNLARLLEQNLARTIIGADQVLRALRNAYLENPEGFDMAAWAGSHVPPDGDAMQVGIIGADGVMKATSAGPVASRIYVGDNEDVGVHANATSDKLFIGKPVKLRTTGKWAFNITRRLTAPDGTYAGVVAASIDAYRLVNLYNSIDLGDNGVAVILGLDGSIRVRRGSNDGLSDQVLGRSIANSTVFTLAHQSPAGNFWSTPQSWDSTRRLFSFRVVADFPLIVQVGFSENTVFAGASKNTRMYLGVAVILSIAVGAAIWMSAVRQHNFLMAQESFRRAEQADIKRAEAEHEHRVAEAELLRERAVAEADLLREREKAAETASRAKSAFLATMSHEIRTPMNAVLGIAEMLLEGNLDDELRRQIAAIHEAGGGLLGILNNVLDFSQIEAGQVSLEHIAFRPEDVLGQVLGIMGPRAKAKNIKVEIVKDPLLPQGLTGDAGRIRQVLLNLVSNAVKFTDTGEVIVGARCTVCDERQATIEWSVSDTGIGIPPERIGDLFAEFVQADNSISRRYGGSGLGLAICKRLVEQMGGEIKAISAPGQGSRFSFTLTLPLAETLPSALPQDHGNNYAALEREIASLGRPLRVLIADDNPTNRQIAAQLLKPFDCQIDMAVNGVEAVKAATETKPDVILMDMRMPEMDGLQATRELRARGGEFATIPIIAITANAFAEDAKSCLRAGMNDFITKPVRKRVLVGAILRTLGGVRPGAAEGSKAGEAAPSQPDQPVTAQAGSLIDQATVDDLLAEIGEDAAGEAFQIFVAETESRLAQLRRMTCAADRPAIEHEAHALKGSAATFGLREVSRLAGGLEREAARIAATDYGALLDRIDAAFATSRTQFPLQMPIAA